MSCRQRLQAFRDRAAMALLVTWIGLSCAVIVLTSKDNDEE